MCRRLADLLAQLSLRGVEHSSPSTSLAGGQLEQVCSTHYLTRLAHEPDPLAVERHITTAPGCSIDSRWTTSPSSWRNCSTRTAAICPRQTSSPPFARSSWITTIRGTSATPSESAARRNPRPRSKRSTHRLAEGRSRGRAPGGRRQIFTAPGEWRSLRPMTSRPQGDPARDRNLHRPSSIRRTLRVW